MSDDESFQRVSSYVERETGFATSHYDDSYLKRRVSARLRRTDAADFEEYLEHLKESDDERTALLDALSVNVTSFFRNPDVWGEIRRVLQTLAEDNGRLKLWSAACSDGREPYSLAMLALDDPHIDAGSVSITATDIDPEILAAAKQGVYESTRTSDIGEQLAPLDDYESYIERDGDQFSVSDEVKSLVTFENHDLISGAPKSDFDFVICRNLFIYIDSEYKRSILTTVSDSLRDGGYLTIGKTETLSDDLKSVFEPVDRRLRIYRKTGATE